MDEELSGYGLTDATWRPLFHLGRLGDGIRQTELAEALGIQGPSLVRLLDNLERDGLISRTVFPVVPPRVDYALTDLGKSLLGLVGALENWAETHIVDVVAAREMYDQAKGGSGSARSGYANSAK